jgi:DNA-binding response OmpR family regulator
LPRCDGYEVLRMLRERKCATRVLMLTARDTEDDIIRGLELGADDYLTKPFSFPELVARLQSVTRPHQPEDARTFEWKNLRVDLTRRLVTRDEVSVDLTRSEFTLLLSLVRSAGQCVTRQKLTESIWGADSNIGSGALDVLVNALRGKIDGPYTQKLIHTVRRSGYMLYPAPPETRHVRG